MKTVKYILFSISFFFILLLASCKEEINIKCNANIIARRDKITVNADFIDNEKRLFNTIKPSVSIYKVEDGKTTDEIETKTMEIEAGTNYDINTSAKEVQFTDLEENKDYTVRIIVSVDGYEHILVDENVTTNNDGSDFENAIVINNIDDFMQIKNDREGFFRLEADLDFENNELSSFFGTESGAFKGGFDGNNHTIKNIQMTNNQQFAGLFGYNQGTIKNLTISNLSIETKRSSEAHVGLVCGYNNGIIENVKVTDSSLVAESTTYSLINPFNVGSICGTVGDKTNTKITNTTVENTTVKATLVNNGHVGGGIGEIISPRDLRRHQIITDNIVEVDLKVTQQLATTPKDKDLEFVVGGFTAIPNGKIENIVAEVNIDASFATTKTFNKEQGAESFDIYVGGLAGRIYSNYSGTIKHALYIGDITVKTTLDYSETETKEETDDKKDYELDVNLYVGSLFGQNNRKHEQAQSNEKINFLAAKVEKITIDAKRINLLGNANVYYGDIFGTQKENYSFDGLQIQLLNEITINTTIDNLTANYNKEGININSVLHEDFSAFIKEYLK